MAPVLTPVRTEVKALPAPPKDLKPAKKKQPDVIVLEKDKVGCRWVEAKASVSFGETDTRHQAKARAIAKARTLAMQKILGTTVEHQFIDFQQEGLKGEVSLTQSLLRATQHGRVLKEDTLAHGPFDLPDCPGCLYGAHIRTCIIPMKDGTDKGFRVEVTLKRLRYVDGDEAEIQITSTRDAYIYLYNVDMDWNATLMFPNVYSTENRIKAGETFVYPTEELKRSVGAQVVAELPKGAEVSAELLRVVAAKSPLPDSILKGGAKRKARGETEIRGSGTFLDLMRRLSASEAEWVDDNVAFTIYKR